MSTCFRRRWVTSSDCLCFISYGLHVHSTQSEFSPGLMLGEGMKAIQGLLHGQSPCDISSNLINLHSVLGQNQSPSIGEACMGCLVKLRGREQGCPVPAERWSGPTKHTPSEMEAFTTRRLWINDVDELINQRRACLQLPPFSVDLVTDLWETGIAECGSWPRLGCNFSGGCWLFV